MYVKLFSELLQSSLWSEDNETRLVWITMLTLADQDGFVAATAPGIAHLARIELDATRKALDIFESPDPDSRTPDHEGKRVERVPGGYMVLNYTSYRDMKNRETERKKTRERVRKHREHKKLPACNGAVTPCNAVTPAVTPCNDIQKQKHIQKQKADKEEDVNLPDFGDVDSPDMLTPSNLTDLYITKAIGATGYSTAKQKITAALARGVDAKSIRKAIIEGGAGLEIWDVLSKFEQKPKPTLTRNALSANTQPRKPDEGAHVFHV